MSPQLRTPLCDLLGIEVPIMQAGMGNVAYSRMAAAVSNAGGLGAIGGIDIPPGELDREIKRFLASREPGSEDVFKEAVAEAGCDTTLVPAFRRPEPGGQMGPLQPLETCFSPVLTLDEAPGPEHSVARSAFASVDGVLQAAPAPRFGRTPGAVAGPAACPGEHTEEALRDWGFPAAEITDLKTRRTIAQLPMAPGRSGTDGISHYARD